MRSRPMALRVYISIPMASSLALRRSHAMWAVEEFNLTKFALAGGVASNSALRAAMKAACEERNVTFYCPPPILCTDNAAMIGSAGFYRLMRGEVAGLDLNATPSLRLV